MDLIPKIHLLFEKQTYIILSDLGLGLGLQINAHQHIVLPTIQHVEHLKQYVMK